MTLERLYTMYSPLGARVFTFSPDSRLLLCCGVSPDSLTDFVVTWDLQTGGTVGVRESPSQARSYPSFTASADGEVIGAAYIETSFLDTFAIRVYSIGSGEQVHSHWYDGRVVGIWAHEGSLRFAAIQPARKMTVWEVGLTPSGPGCHTVTTPVVETLTTPPDLNLTEPLVFFPALHKISYVSGNILKIWDAKEKIRSLHVRGLDFNGPTMSFSPDGRFFACGTVGSDVYLWKDCAGGYTFHRKITSSVISPSPLFSPDSSSVITWGRSTIQIWPLEDPVTTPDDILQTSEQRCPFVLGFSPDEGSVAYARLNDTTVTVINPRTGAQKTVIDAGVEIYGLRVDNDTVTVDGDGKLATWDLPKEDDASNGTATLRDCVLSTTSEAGFGSKHTSISPDLLMIARSWGGRVGWLIISDAKTGKEIGATEVDCEVSWFTPDGSQIWCSGGVGKEQGWEIVRAGVSTKISLVPLAGSPPKGWPWRSSRGYTVADDGWTLSRESNKVLWLPPRWKSDDGNTRMWSGGFLALLHRTLTDPVILELDAGKGQY